MVSEFPSSAPERRRDGDRFDVFISYAREDAALAESLRNGLAERGIACWLDRERLKPGEDWMTALSDAINASKICLLILGRHLDEKPWVSMEWALVQESAWKRNDLTIVPVLFDKVEPPMFLKHWQFLRCERRPADIERVCSQVADLLEHRGRAQAVRETSQSARAETAQRFKELESVLETAKAAVPEERRDSK